MNRSPRNHREGKILVLVAVLLPTFFGIAGLVLDGGTLMSESRHVQHIADAAATAAAYELRQGNSVAAAKAAAAYEVQTANGKATANVTVNIPPLTGPHTGQSSFAEVRVKLDVPTHLISLLNGKTSQTVEGRSVAGCKAATSGAAIVALDPNPTSFAIGNISLLPVSLPSLLGGVEVLGLGDTSVDGAVLINNKWAGVDEDGLTVGMKGNPLRHAATCTPLLPLTRFKARDIRCVGGVDDRNNYLPYTGNTKPLKANRLPVPDPYENLPVPTTANGAVNVKRTVIPLLQTLLGGTLNPGVYETIDITSLGTVTFNPGIYIIRGRPGLTTPQLNIVAGRIVANGVLFYLTDSSDYSPTTGAPDASDGETTPAAPQVTTLLPSAIINIGLLGSSYSGLNSPGSPFHGMLIYQRRADRRPIIMVQENLLGPGSMSGAIYAKWGHVLLAGKGDYNLSIVAGTVRLLALLNMKVAPTTKLPPAYDVFLVE